VDLDTARASRQRRVEVGLDPGQQQPALAGREGDRRVAGLAERQRAPVRGQRQVGRDLGQLGAQQRAGLGAGDLAVAVGVELLRFLEGRDLGLVEDVVKLGAAVGDPHLAQVVDAEVAQGMGGGAGWHQRRARDCRGDAQNCDPAALHPSAPRARCARGP